MFAQELIALGGSFRGSMMSEYENIPVSHVIVRGVFVLDEIEYELLVEQKETDLSRILAVISPDPRSSAVAYRYLQGLVNQDVALKNLRIQRLLYLFVCIVFGGIFSMYALYVLAIVLLFRANLFLFVGSLLLLIFGIVIIKNRRRVIVRLLPKYKRLSYERRGKINGI